jgi:gluconokinase
MACVLALDVGTTMARAGVFDADGSPVRPPARDLHGGLDDPDALVAVARRLVDEVRAHAEGAPAAVGVSCFWHSLVVLDAAGAPLTPVLGWRGGAAAGDADALGRRLDAADLHRRTGLPLHAAYWPAKLAWLRRTQPDVLRRAGRLVSFSEYLLARLTDSPVGAMSLSMASGTGLLRTDDPRWDEELLAVLELDEALLPPLSDEPTGRDPAWFPAVGDGACANLGMGATTPDRAGLSVGTSGALRVVVDRPADPRPALFLLRVDAERYALGGALSDAGNLYHHLRRSLRIGPEADEALRLREPGEHGLVVLPLPGGERSPGWDAGARGAIAGLSYDTTPLDLFHATLEGIALRFGELADHLPEVREVVVAGGSMARAAAWLQVLADALGLPVVRSGVDEASARGAAVLALERLGLRPAPAPVAERYEPRPERTEAYRALRERQRALYAATVATT